MFDKMMGVKLASGVFTNDAGKNFERKFLFFRGYSKAILILFY